MKTCARCKIEKEESEFNKASSRKDGLCPYCRICKSLESKKYNTENREKCREKLRKWREENPQKNTEYSQVYREKNHEKIRARASTKSSKEKQKVASKRWYEENKEHVRKVNAEWKRKNRKVANSHSLVAKHVKLGKLLRPKRCQKCKTDQGKMEAHHEDYDKPLEVVWLCFKCHKKIHGKLLDVSTNA